MVPDWVMSIRLCFCVYWWRSLRKRNTKSKFNFTKPLKTITLFLRPEKREEVKIEKELMYTPSVPEPAPVPVITTDMLNTIKETLNTVNPPPPSLVPSNPVGGKFFFYFFKDSKLKLNFPKAIRTIRKVVTVLHPILLQSHHHIMIIKRIRVIEIVEHFAQIRNQRFNHLIINLFMIVSGIIIIETIVMIIEEESKF